jgi:hypothetical protein
MELVVVVFVHNMLSSHFVSLSWLEVPIDVCPVLRLIYPGIFGRLVWCVSVSLPSEALCVCVCVIQQGAAVKEESKHGVLLAAIVRSV